MDIILIGAPGAGKGTQAHLLAQMLSVTHISSSDLFRKAFEEKTELGLRAQAFVDLGELVPNEMTIPMVVRCIEAPESSQGVLLDGFPRNLQQAQALDAELEHLNRQIGMVIYLNVPPDELARRIGERVFCEAHQHVYNATSHPPKVAGVCDLDGSTLYRRLDDAGEAVRRRLVIFFGETVQLLDYYRKQNKLREVNGNQSIEQVQTMILKEINDQESRETKV